MEKYKAIGLAAGIWTSIFFVLGILAALSPDEPVAAEQNEETSYAAGADDYNGSEGSQLAGNVGESESASGYASTSEAHAVKAAQDAEQNNVHGKMVPPTWIDIKIDAPGEPLDVLDIAGWGAYELTAEERKDYVMGGGDAYMIPVDFNLSGGRTFNKLNLSFMSSEGEIYRSCDDFDDDSIKRGSIGVTTNNGDKSKSAIYHCVYGKNTNGNGLTIVAAWVDNQRQIGLDLFIPAYENSTDAQLEAEWDMRSTASQPTTTQKTSPAQLPAWTTSRATGDNVVCMKDGFVNIRIEPNILESSIKAVMDTGECGIATSTVENGFTLVEFYIDQLGEKRSYWVHNSQF